MDKLKVCHIASDEKFINAAEYLFEQSFPSCNYFCIIVGRNFKSFRHIQLESNYRIYRLSNQSIVSIINEINTSDVIVYHGFDNIQATIFHRSNKKNSSIWLLWGAEVYNDLLDITLYGQKTLKIKTSQSYNLREFIKKLIFKLKPTVKLIESRQKLAEIISNIPTLGVLYKEEYDYFVSLGVVKKSTNFLKFTYYPIEFLLNDLKKRIVGNDILIGNSASLTNNHLEIIDILKDLNTDKRVVYIPLNYGDIEYAKIVKNYAIKNLDYCIPILKFLPIVEYNQILMKSGIVIMNHYRQQAVGNVLMAIYFGSKVYLNETTLYSYLKRIGCIVFSISKDLNIANKNCLENLSEADIEINRQIIINEISTDRIVKNLREFINYKTN